MNSEMSKMQIKLLNEEAVRQMAERLSKLPRQQRRKAMRDLKKQNDKLKKKK